MKRSLGARTIAVPTPTWVVGTYDSAGRANAATVAWAGICCSRPQCVAVSLRRATYTHILDRTGAVELARGRGTEEAGRRSAAVPLGLG